MARAKGCAALRLVHTTDLDPGFRRKRRGKGFIYVDPSGNKLSRGEHLERINALAIPPAYKAVWICLSENGHLQATGRDARSRKQYRYHSEWLRRRNEAKFGQLISFANDLPKIREQVGQLLRMHTIGRDQVSALALAIIDRTGARIGNAAYREQNGTYGITTLANRHASIGGRQLKLNYIGKHGKKVALKVESSALSRRLTKCRELPGQALFEYQDPDGEIHALDSSDVNDLLARIADGDFTAKMFRTWRGSLIAFEHLLDSAEPESPTERKKVEVAAVRSAASELHNTMATSRKYYIHPEILNAWINGSFTELVLKAKRSKAFSNLSNDKEKLFARFLKQLDQ